MAIKKLLIANRGEVALRVLRACRTLGIETVAAHSKVDRDLRHVMLADDSVCVSEHSYLDPQAFVVAAVSRGCDAVHPGYGLLSENADFARRVTDAGLIFVGPATETMARMGDKASAREVAASLGLDTVPGTLTTGSELNEWAASVGYPVLVKAVHGGGGRGMRIVPQEKDLESALRAARHEAEAGFGSGEVYVEKYLDHARHVEVQVLGDGKGNAVHLGTRDCSVQRNYQKVIEEAPAPFIEAAALDELGAKAASAAAGMNYAGVGTFEFLYQDGHFYFIEMNTRLQVEHPVTEMVTGLDLVRAQIEVAAEGKLPFAQDDIVLQGHAIECRINAESMDEQGRLRPSPGRITDLIIPGGPGIRIDSHLYVGYSVPHQYDSLIMKLIAHGRDREEATHRLTAALGELEIRGIDTNAELLRIVARSAGFGKGDLGPGLLAEAANGRGRTR